MENATQPKPIITPELVARLNADEGLRWRLRDYYCSRCRRLAEAAVAAPDEDTQRNLLARLAVAEAERDEFCAAFWWAANFISSFPVENPPTVSYVDGRWQVSETWQERTACRKTGR